MKKIRHFWQGKKEDFVFQCTVIASRCILCLETSHNATGAKTNTSQIAMRLTATSEWFNKESNWFLYTIMIYQYIGIFALLLWAESNYFRERKRKCGISNADAERQVARLYKKNASKKKKMLLCSHIYWHLFPKVKGQDDQSQLNSSVQNVSRQTT